MFERMQTNPKFRELLREWSQQKNVTGKPIKLIHVTPDTFEEEPQDLHTDSVLLTTFLEKRKKPNFMKKDKSQEKFEDPYTGEEKKPVEDADDIIKIIPVDPGTRTGEDYLLKEETAMDAIAVDEKADAIPKKSARLTNNDEVEKMFEDRQVLADSGRKELKEVLDQYHAKSPKLSGGDLDADWSSASSVGEETVGGQNPTPDQDVVGELGEAVGLTYDDDEPVAGAEKLNKRDDNRWELDPRSAEEDSAA